MLAWWEPLSILDEFKRFDVGKVLKKGSRRAAFHKMNYTRASHDR